MFPTHTEINQDWQACKNAHTAAVEQADLERAWGSLMKGAASPFIEFLQDKALSFKVKHGIEFDPRQPAVNPIEERA